MSDFDRLQHLLLDSERQRLDALERQRANLAEELPALIGEAQRAQPEALAGALANPVAEALGGAVQSRRQQIVDALFPIIMPAIRRSIAEYLRSVSQDLNRIFESSLTWRGLTWRLEARRLGVSYATVALRHSLLYQVDHLFLIQRDSGLILDRESAAGLPDLDADAVAGMLTAIGDFVRDSVGAGEGELSSATVGEHLLWVIGGPSANLAAWIRGVPPESLKQELVQRLERVHEQFGVQLAGSPETLGSLPGLRDALTPSDLKAIRADSQPDPSLQPVLWATAAILLLVLTIGVALWQWQARVDQIVAELDQSPGIEVIGKSSWPWWSLDLQVLKDPHAAGIQGIVQPRLPDHVTLRVRTQSFVSAEPGMIALRLRARFSLPDSVTAQVNGDQLVLAGPLPPDVWHAVHGHAADLAAGLPLNMSGLSPDWPAALSSLGRWPETVQVASVAGTARLTGTAPPDWVTGVQALVQQKGWSPWIDLSGLHVDELGALARLNADLRDQVVMFEQGAAEAGIGWEVLAAKLADALTAMGSADLRLRVSCIGLSDPSGAEDGNRRLERSRAAWLCEQLSAQHLNPALTTWQVVDAPGDLATLRQRAALVQLERIDRP